MGKGTRRTFGVLSIIGGGIGALVPLLAMLGQLASTGLNMYLTWYYAAWALFGACLALALTREALDRAGSVLLWTAAGLSVLEVLGFVSRRVQWIHGDIYYVVYIGVTWLGYIVPIVFALGLTRTRDIPRWLSVSGLILFVCEAVWVLSGSWVTRIAFTAARGATEVLMWYFSIRGDLTNVLALLAGLFWVALGVVLLVMSRHGEQARRVDAVN